MDETHSATSCSDNFLNTGVAPIPVPCPPFPRFSNPAVVMIPNWTVFSSITPSNPSLSVRRAVWIASSSDNSSVYLSSRLISLKYDERYEKTHRFSRNVLAFTWFLPIALAFHAQNEPDGSTWYIVCPFALSNPATNNDTPYGLTPLPSLQHQLQFQRGLERNGTHPD